MSEEHGHCIRWQVVDHDLLMLIEPASEASKKERKRIKERLAWADTITGLGLAYVSGFNAFEFLHLTGNLMRLEKDYRKCWARY